MPAEVPNQARGLQPTKSQQMVSNLFRKQFATSIEKTSRKIEVILFSACLLVAGFSEASDSELKCHCRELVTVIIIIMQYYVFVYHVLVFFFVSRDVLVFLLVHFMISCEHVFR